MQSQMNKLSWERVESNNVWQGERQSGKAWGGGGTEWCPERHAWDSRRQRRATEQPLPCVSHASVIWGSCHSDCIDQRGEAEILYFSRLSGDADVAGSEDRSGTIELPAYTSWTFAVGVASRSDPGWTCGGLRGTW